MSPRSPFPLLALAFALGCGGQTAAPTSENAGDASSASSGQPLPQCTWPAALDPPDARPSWSIGRTFLECKGGNVFEDCISDDPKTCPPSPGGPTLPNCVDQCGPSEYAVMYGGPPLVYADGGSGEYPMPNLPAACRGVASFPSGAAVVCCPCE